MEAATATAAAAAAAAAVGSLWTYGSPPASTTYIQKASKTIYCNEKYGFSIYLLQLRQF